MSCSVACAFHPLYVEEMLYLQRRLRFSSEGGDSTCFALSPPGLLAAKMDAVSALIASVSFFTAAPASTPLG